MGFSPSKFSGRGIVGSMPGCGKGAVVPAAPSDKGAVAPVASSGKGAVALAVALAGLSGTAPTWAKGGTGGCDSDTMTGAAWAWA